MNKLKLNIELIPKGAWGNNLRTLLPKKDWDYLREECCKKANHKCQICGYDTDNLDAHEIWQFNVNNKTQTLKNIIGICSKCHGVKHIKNSERLGYGENAKMHFMRVNNCNELQFASYLTKAQLDFEEKNQIYRWNIHADLNKFGLKNTEIKQRNIPFIKNPYENIVWDLMTFGEKKNIFKTFQYVYHPYWMGPPKVQSIFVDNYQGIINVICYDTNKIEWYLDDVKIKTKYNVVGKFIINFKVENLKGNKLYFKLSGDGGETLSEIFEILPQEVL